jgi:hypothetical protein
MFLRKVAQNFSQEEAAFATLIANQDGHKRVLSPGAMPTLTESRLLAVLLEHQRSKVIQSAWHHTWQEKLRAAFWRTLSCLLQAGGERTLGGDPAKPLIGTTPHHT